MLPGNANKLNPDLYDLSKPLSDTLIDWNGHIRTNLQTHGNRVRNCVIHLAGGRRTGYVQNQMATVNEIGSILAFPAMVIDGSLTESVM